MQYIPFLFKLTQNQFSATDVISLNLRLDKISKSPILKKKKIFRSPMVSKTLFELWTVETTKMRIGYEAAYFQQKRIYFGRSLSKLFFHIWLD